jgi:hypothetical protein
MHTPLEVAGEDKYVAWAKEYQILCVKVKFVVAGFPDRLSVLPNGLHVWIEFKRLGEKPEPIQLYRMKTLRDSGALVGWTDDYTVAIRVVQALLAAPSLPVTSDTPTAEPERGWAVPRSWFGQDFCLSCVLKDIETERLYEESFNHSPPEADV